MRVQALSGFSLSPALLPDNFGDQFGKARLRKPAFRVWQTKISEDIPTALLNANAANQGNLAPPETFLFRAHFLSCLSRLVPSSFPAALSS
jgi:hypothetical protein